MAEGFQKDEYVVYGKVGVCRVVDHCEMTFGGENGEYYVLSPQSDPRSSLYVPCRNETLMARLRPLMTPREIDDLLDGVGEEPLPWPEEKNERSRLFRAAAAGDRFLLVRLIRCLYERKRERAALGKRFASADETMLTECVRLLEEELSLSLGMPRSRVPAYIAEHIEKTAVTE